MVHNTLAQRVAFRICLEEVPANLMLLTGRTATVTVQNGTVYHRFDIPSWR